MPSVVEICNFALSHLRIAPGIASLTERSEEARVCNLFYEQTRDEVLRDFSWPFATRIEALALVAEQPNAEWGYSYRYPARCLFFRRILGGAGRRETRETRVPYRIAEDDAGSLIYTDQPLAQGEFTALADNPVRYPADFVQAFSLLLASYIAPRAAGGDLSRLGERAFQLYEFRIRAAWANAANEEQVDLPGPSSLLAARNG